VDVAALDLEGDGDMDFACLDGGASIFIPASSSPRSARTIPGNQSSRRS